MPKRKPETLTITRAELWPAENPERQVKLGIEFTGGHIEFLLRREEAAKLVGDLRTHFGL